MSDTANPGAVAPATATEAPVTPAAQPAAAPDIAQREASREQTWESLKQELLGVEVTPSADGLAPVQTPPAPADPWEEHKPKGPPIQSLRDRLLAKEGRQQELARTQQLEAQLAERERLIQENQLRQQQADRAYEEAKRRGDADGMARARGLQSFEELQRAKLIEMGQLPPPVQDPRVDQVIAWAQQQEAQRQQQHQAWQQQQEQQRRQQEYQQHLDIAKAELLALKLPDIQEFVELPGAVPSVFQLMAQNQNLTTAQAAALVREDYLKQLGDPVSKWLAKVGKVQPVQAGAPPATGGLPAAAPLGQRPANLSREEAWEWDKRELGWT